MLNVPAAGLSKLWNLREATFTVANIDAMHGTIKRIVVTARAK